MRFIELYVTFLNDEFCFSIIFLIWEDILKEYTKIFASIVLMRAKQVSYVCAIR